MKVCYAAVVCQPLRGDNKRNHIKKNIKFCSLILHNHPSKHCTFYLLKVNCQVGPKFDRKIPPDLQFSEHKSFSPDMNGNEWLKEELQTLTAAQNICSKKKKETNETCGWFCKLSTQTPENKRNNLPGLRAKLSIRLFQAMKAIFLILGEELRKPNSSKYSKELMNAPPL